MIYDSYQNISFPASALFFVLFSESVFILSSGIVSKPFFFFLIFQCQNSHLAAASALANHFPVYLKATLIKTPLDSAHGYITLYI